MIYTGMEVINVTALSLMEALEAVRMTASNASIDDKTVIHMTFPY